MYAAADHLLAVNDLISTEEYRRFYFSDIQVLTVGRTHHGKILNAVGACLAFVMIMAVVGTAGTEGAIIFGVLAAIVVVALVLNIVAGPTAAMALPSTSRSPGCGSLVKFRHDEGLCHRLADRAFTLAAHSQSLAAPIRD